MFNLDISMFIYNCIICQTSQFGSIYIFDLYFRVADRDMFFLMILTVFNHFVDKYCKNSVSWEGLKPWYGSDHFLKTGSGSDQDIRIRPDPRPRYIYIYPYKKVFELESLLFVYFSYQIVTREVANAP